MIYSLSVPFQGMTVKTTATPVAAHSGKFMTIKTSPKPDLGLPTQRLIELLKRLGQRGITQAEVARRANVPAQYLSDVRNQRRPLTELFARRLAEEFEFDYQWLLGKKNTSHQSVRSAEPAGGESLRLPVFPHPIDGDPLANAKWDGVYVEVGGSAAARAVHAVHPYVLRIGQDDKKGRLNKGDLILISQSLSETADLSVVLYKKKCFLARKKNGSWVHAATNRAYPSDLVVTGHCVGIVWADLC